VTSYTRSELQREVDRLGAMQPWNHNFRLADGVETRPDSQYSAGKNEVKLERLQSLLDAIGIAGKRILDVGCNEGFFAVTLAQAGASVSALDIDDKRIEKAMFIRDALGIDVDYAVESIYSPEFMARPTFDVGLALGLLHRIPDPFAALDHLGRKCDILVLEWKALRFGPHDQPFAWFTPGDYRTDDYYGTQFWLLSFAAVEAMLRRLGFRHFVRLNEGGESRAILVAGRVDNPVFRRSSIVTHRGRLRALASHTKAYLRSVSRILSGELNA
jgi:SAM-dependent methyltransferase